MFEKEKRDALKAAGLDESLFTLVNAEQVEDINGAVATLKNVISPIIQKTGDQRATAATQTAINNYEAKHKLKDGKLVELNLETNTESQKHGEKPEMAKLMELMGGLAEEVKGLKTEKAANERSQQIKAKLSKAGIPDLMQKRFSVSSDADDVSIDTAISEYKNELIELKVAGISQPEINGGSTASFESKAKKIAENRNAGKDSTGSNNVPAKEL